MAFVLPPKSQVGALDPEFLNEGVKVHINSEGEQVTWDVAPVKPIVPDMSGIKSIARYFAKKPYRAFPAWLYHPKEASRLVRNEHEAAEIGICYREASIEERGRYGVTHVWDWKDDCEWRPKPYHAPKFDPDHPGNGKSFVPTPANAAKTQHDLVAAVAAAVAREMKVSGPAAPAHVNPAQWDEFLKFQAWQKSQEAVNVLTAAVDEAENMNSDPELALSPEEFKEKLIALAAEHNIKVDKRWSVDRIKAALDEAA